MNHLPSRRPFVALVITVLVGAALCMGTPAGAVAQEEDPAPLLGAENATVIQDRYVVVLRHGTTGAERRAVQQQARGAGGQVDREYAAALSGFSATLSPEALEKVRRHPNVEFVEAEFTVSLSETQSPATWGLDRIDQRNLPLSNSYTWTGGGAGVNAYIIDTGVRFSHNEFGGRATSGFDAIDGGSADDCNGHGTHVAGTVAGTTYGVAKRASIIGVRVLNCQGSGTNTQVIAGIDWVTSHHGPGQPAVANMSLGGGISAALDAAVSNSINDGVSYAVAAGNSNANACNGSPSRVGPAITVGATTSSDARSSFSNFGTCLDIFAPGSSITSAWYTSNTATNTISGTSMATPHVAGAAALYLGANPSAGPQAVRDNLVNTATTGVISNVGTGSPNRLLFVGAGTQPPPPPPPPPGCGGLPEQFTGSLSGTGASQLHPNGTYFFTASSGTHRGCLDGPAGVDFDLYLQKWNGFSWSSVASGTSPAPDESVTYNGTSGYYRWRVYSYSGSGSYAFGMQRP
jgi:aqualysin 1